MSPAVRLNKTRHGIAAFILFVATAIAAWMDHGVGALVAVLGVYCSAVTVASSGTRRMLVALAWLFAILPWFGFGVGALSWPGSGESLPTFELLEGTNLGLQILGVVLKPLFLVAELPLAAAVAAGTSLESFLTFVHGRGTIRPFSVFLFWLVTAALCTAICFVLRFATANETRPHSVRSNRSIRSVKSGQGGHHDDSKTK